MEIVQRKSRTKEQVNAEYKDICEQMGDAMAHLAQYELKINSLKRRSFELYEEFRTIEERDSEIEARIISAKMKAEEKTIDTIGGKTLDQNKNPEA
ncbi:MAG: hypothetical protein E6R03_02270 [Hyphomicrobiaceae bacterium]|nr:MAG: hypothetical protein E6R03_02270 [Hyphomicrobiaceae bacterium]